jgi:uncharacterized protein (DUF302 family)
MTDFTMSTTLDRSYDETVAAVRTCLADAGFGVLTEIDVRATMKAKLDLDVPGQVILGACRPQLAHLALTAVPAIGALLPCNVVVREVGEHSTVVETIDPDAMVLLADDPVVREVAAEAKQRLRATLDALDALHAVQPLTKG